MDTTSEQRVFANRYQLTERIGVGGMAEVYGAVDLELNRKVAIKVLHSRLGSDSLFVERFRREARAAAGLNHPNIVQVYDWGKEGETNFLVMELLEGDSLKQLINERGPLPHGEAASIALQVLAALEYAHENRVIHRDIKPHNIMVSPAGHVKVTDFGIAHAQAEASTGATVTQEGFLIGTAQYCSPEQAQGRPVVRGSDLYSLGIVLYEMLTKRVPFDADNPVSVAVMQVKDAPARPREIRPDIPLELEQVVMKALAKIPEERFPTAADMSQALERARTSMRGAMAAGGAAARPLDEQPTIIAPRPRQAAPGAEQYSFESATDIDKDLKKGPGRRRLAWIGLAVVLLLLGALAAYALIGGGGPGTVRVPDLKELTLEQAKTALGQSGLEVGKINQDASDEVDEGLVFDQSPEAGDQVKKGTKVNIWVSTGPANVTVPDVVGDNFEDARDTLEDAGFKVNIVREFNETVEKDKVISQQPAGDDKATKGSTVDLIVSDGAEPVEKVVVPSVVGLSLSEALAKLRGKDLRADQDEEFSDDVPEGEVIRQSPQAGAEVAPNSVVTIFISKGPREVEVPNVQGLPESSAVRILKRAGLKVKTSEEENSIFEPGTVIGQSPVQGTVVPRGTTVVLRIAKAPSSTTTSSTTSTTSP